MPFSTWIGPFWVMQRPLHHSNWSKFWNCPFQPTPFCNSLPSTVQRWVLSGTSQNDGYFIQQGKLIGYENIKDFLPNIQWAQRAKMVALNTTFPIIQVHYLISATWLTWHLFLAFGQPRLSCVDHVSSLRASHKFYPQAPAKGLVNYYVCGRAYHMHIND